MGIGSKIFFIDFLSNIGRVGLNNIENMWHICSKDSLIFFQNIPVIVFSLLGNVFAMILPNTFFSWFEMGVFVNSSQKKKKKGDSFLFTVRILFQYNWRHDFCLVWPDWLPPNYYRTLGLSIKRILCQIDQVFRFSDSLRKRSVVVAFAGMYTTGCFAVVTSRRFRRRMGAFCANRIRSAWKFLVWYDSGVSSA